MSQDALKHFVHLRQDRDRERTLFLLHGTGGNEADLLPLAAPLGGEYNLVGLRGNVSESGMPRFFARTGPGVFDQKSLNTELEKLAEFLRAWYQEYALDPDQAAFLGYSNGANMLLATLLHHPDVIRTAALLHPMMPFEPEAAELEGGRYLVTYGERDPMIPAAESRRVVDALRALGAEVQVASHAGGHQLAQAELDALYAFLKPAE